MAKAKVTGGSLHFRSGASVEASVIGILANNTAVTVLGTDGEWSKIRYKNREGFVMTRYLNLAPGGKAAGVKYAPEDKAAGVKDAPEDKAAQAGKTAGTSKKPAGKKTGMAGKQAE